MAKAKKEPVILITNDDGVTAPGIQNLVEAVKDLGKVVVVAPDKPQSGMGHAITIGMPLRLHRVHYFGDIEAWQCSGTPVECVKLAVDKVLHQKPDICLSGINHGANHSINVIYSGTMSAAVEAAIESIPSVELFGSDGVRLGLSAPICLQFGGSVWSPAGTHLAVYCGGDLTILNPDGTTSAVYSEANAQFAVGSWSPDGATLALGDNNGMVRLLSDDGAPIADPYSAAISNITNLEWHPSGKVLASGAPGVEIALRYAWSESEACETLRDIFDPLEMDQILRVDGYHSRCGLGTVVSFPLIPSMGRPPLPI